MHLDLGRELGPALDDHLDRLGADLGGRDVAADVVRAFLGELEPRLDELRAADLAGDGDARARVAHKLRSTALLVGLERLAAGALALEQGGSDVDPVCQDARAGARALRRWLFGLRG